MSGNHGSLCSSDFLAFLCVCGIATFCKNIKNNYWWRWIYIFGGSYVLFDLFAIAIELKVWNALLLFMFDVNSQYWNIVWGFFIILGAFVFCLGMKLSDGTLWEVHTAL